MTQTVNEGFFAEGVRVVEGEGRRPPVSRSEPVK